MNTLKIAREQSRALWLNIWNGRPPGMALLTLAAITALIMAIPILYVFLRAIQGGKERWLLLLNQRIPELMYSTLTLAFVVTMGAILLGTLSAFLVVRTDLPGKKTWQWLLALPLVIPPYVGAITYIIIFGPTGWAKEILGTAPFNIYTFWPVAFILILFTYPYVYLITSSSLKRMNRNYEEAALSLGLPYWQVLPKVTLPLLRPALGAGAILVILYVLSDFGVVALLRYPTFSSSIYFQITGRFDRSGAAILSTILIMLTMIFIYLEHKTRERQKYYQTNSYRKPSTISLGKWKTPALILIVLITTFALLLPLSVLTYWSYQGIAKGALNQNFLNYTLNSLKVSALAAILAMLLALPVVYLKSRYPGKITSLIDKIVYAGYALPGVVVALGVIFIFNTYLPWFYATPAMLVLAYIIRFLPQSLQASGSALNQVSPKLDDAARSLGSTPLGVIRKVTFPTILPGVLAGGALVFISSLKELPATLLLRPAGYDTLSVRIWIEASEGFYDMAAPLALLIILVSILPIKWMLEKY